MSVEAFNEVYRRYAKDVYRFALWLTGRPEEAEEVVAETFIRVWTRWQRVRTETVKGYILAIARSVVRERGRRHRPEEPLDPATVDQQATPEEVSAQRSELGVVLAALRELPAVDREVFALRVVEELPYAEIARIMEISLSAAKVRVHRIRIKLAAKRLGGTRDETHA